MKNTVSRGILFYIFLLIAVVLGVLCVLGAILIFSPGTEIFGISYYINTSTQHIKTALNDSNNQQSIDSLFTSGQIDTINITTNYANVSLETRQDGAVQFIIEPSLTGLMTSENKDTYSYTSRYTASDKTLSVSINAPTMFLAFNNTIDLVLCFPENVTNTNLNINITTERGDITIGHHELDVYTLDNLTVNVEDSSNVTFGIHTVISDNITLNVPSGNIRFRRAITTGNLTINSESTKIETGNINANEFTLFTQSSSINLGNITVESNFNYNARRGVMIVGDINGNLNCGEGVDNVFISNITAGTINGDVLLPNAESSNITIKTLNGRGDIVTTSGDVTIEKATSFLWVSTQSGKIDVNIDTASDLNTQSYAEDQGIVNLKSNNGTINVNFANLLLKNYISSQRGTINCKFSPTLNFILNYTCPENAPSLSDGITTGEAANEASIAIGNSSTDKAIYLENLEGRTSIEDTYAA